MNTVVMGLQVVVALGLLNVWLLRFNQGTKYRGGSARTMLEEFAAYGLPAGFAYVIGVLKVGSALALLAGLWLPALVFPAAALVCVLMVGALAMHAKIRDPLSKSVPALAMLAAALTICWASMR
ncbi:MAG: DoxX family protein [Acidobacteria bacterium]|nr:DoxX family protein [Acidobacteriota bacterium]